MGWQPLGALESRRGSALGVALTDSGEGIALCDTLEAYARAAFPEAEVRVGAGARGAAMVAEGPDQSTVLRCDGDLVRLGIAPDLDVARAVAADA